MDDINFYLIFFIIDFNIKMSNQRNNTKGYGKLFTQLDSLKSNISELITYKKNHSKSPIPLTQRNHCQTNKPSQSKNINKSIINQHSHKNIKLSVSKLTKENKQNEVISESHNSKFNDLLNLILKISEDNQ